MCNRGEGGNTIHERCINQFSAGEDKKKRRRESKDIHESCLQLSIARDFNSKVCMVRNIYTVKPTHGFDMEI